MQTAATDGTIGHSDAKENSVEHKKTISRKEMSNICSNTLSQKHFPSNYGMTYREDLRGTFKRCSLSSNVCSSYPNVMFIKQYLIPENRINPTDKSTLRATLGCCGAALGALLVALGARLATLGLLLARSWPHLANPGRSWAAPGSLLGCSWVAPRPL
jgi:hypothetical protein